MKRTLLKQLRFLTYAICLFSGLFCFGSVMVGGAIALEQIGLAHFNTGGGPGDLAACLVSVLVCVLLCILCVRLGRWLGGKIDKLPTGKKKIRVVFDRYDGKWYSEVEGGQRSEAGCRDCKYYARRLDDDAPYCEFHKFLFEGNYKTCEYFTYSGPTETAGPGCLVWIIEIAVIALALWLLLGRVNMAA